MQTSHFLKSTGERITVLGEETGKGGKYYRCKLPPQQSWHKPRFQNVSIHNVLEQKSNV